MVSTNSSANTTGDYWRTRQQPSIILFKALDNSASSFLVPGTIASIKSASSTTTNLLREPHKESFFEEEFSRALRGSFECEPLEDGYSHPAERIIEEAIVKYSVLTVADWIQSAYLRSVKLPTVCASILRCVGRLDRRMTGSWGLVLAISGLSHPEVEVREAAVRALEAWGGHDSIETLKVYENIENVQWLKDYIKRVIVDLSD